MRVPVHRPSARSHVVALVVALLVGAAIAGPAAAAAPGGHPGPSLGRTFILTPAGGGWVRVTISAASMKVTLDARGLQRSATYQLRATIGPARPVLATFTASSRGTANVSVPWKRPATHVARISEVSLGITVPGLVAVLSDGYWPDTCYPNYYEPPCRCQWTFHAYDSTGPIVLYQLEYYMEDPAGNPSYGVPYRDNDPSLGDLGIYVTTGPGYYAEFTLTVYDIHGNTASDTNEILWAG